MQKKLSQSPLQLHSGFKEDSFHSCQDMVNAISKNLKNGVDYLLVDQDNQTIRLKNNEWNIYKYGMYLLGKNITVTVQRDSQNNELGYLKIRTSHLWIKDYSSIIHCNELGHLHGYGPGKGQRYAGGGY